MMESASAPEQLAARARTALTRIALSRPVQRALDDGIIDESTSVFDYGCGLGGDIQRLERRGIAASGWDPTHHSGAPLHDADVVNLGYVLNVIEEQRERARTLERAWALARNVLVVSARLDGEARELDAVPEGDGVRTSTGTFQKFFRQQELKAWVEQVLEQHAVPAAPGVLYVFREPVLEQAYLARRVRRTIRRAPVSRALLERHGDLISAITDFVGERGRLPRSGELGCEAAVREAFGTVRAAWAVVRRVTGDEPWDRVRDARSADLLVFLAAARFGRRPRLGELPPELQLDLRDLFGSYKSACAQADRLLFAVGDSDRVAAAARASGIGKLLPAALYVHVDALHELPPILRVYEATARALVGQVDEATLLKLHLDRPAVSYLAYPTFDVDPHPPLHSGYVVKLDRLAVDYRNYSEHNNPAILHRKELFLHCDDPRRDKFARLTGQEVRAGLFAHPSRIGLRQGWEAALAEAGVAHRGHRLVRSSRGG